MWHFTDASVLRCCYAFGLSAAKSVWRHPATCRQLNSRNFVVTKPSFRHISCYVFSLHQPTLIGRSAGLLKLCSTCARHAGSVKYLQPQRCAFAKQLRHASNTKAFPTVVSGPAQHMSKRNIPQASDVYRLLALAKPEKWKLLGENWYLFLYCAAVFCRVA